jgi:hypothetical protein
MKSKVLQLTLLISFLLTGLLSTNGQTKKSYIGNWSFEAPNAPEGYTYGIIEIKKDTILTSFTELKYRVPSIWIKFKNDSITYKSFVDDTDVLFSLKIVDEANIKGNAVWSDGETQMILHKKTNQEIKKQNP